MVMFEDAALSARRPFIYLGPGGQQREDGKITLAQVERYDAREWDSPWFGWFNEQTGKYRRWPPGSIYERNNPSFDVEGGSVIVDPAMLIPGAVYGMGQFPRRAPGNRRITRLKWTGLGFLPEGPDADAETAAYLKEHPESLKMHGMTSQPPLTCLTGTGKRDEMGRIVVAEVAPYNDKTWKMPWIGIPSRTGRGYDFVAELDEGAIVRIGRFEGTHADGGVVVANYLATGQVYCVGQTCQRDKARSIKQHIKWDGEWLYACDRDGTFLEEES